MRWLAARSISPQVWWALAVFAALLAGESVLWRFGSWFGYRAILVDKAEAKLDLFNHLSGHSSRYFSDRMGGSLANRDLRDRGLGAAGVLGRCCSISLRYAPISAPLWRCWRPSSGIWSPPYSLSCCWPRARSCRLSRRGMPRHRLHADRAAEVGGELVDVLSNIWVVKAFSARTRERRRFERLLEDRGKPRIATA